MSFSEATLIDVIRDLEAYYDQKIVLEGTDKPTCSFTGSFENQPISEIFEILELTCQLTVQNLDGGYLMQVN